MVALSTAFYARLSIGSRQIVEIFQLLAIDMSTMDMSFSVIAIPILSAEQQV